MESFDGIDGRWFSLSSIGVGIASTETSGMISSSTSKRRTLGVLSLRRAGLRIDDPFRLGSLPSWYTDLRRVRWRILPSWWFRGCCASWTLCMLPCSRLLTRCRFSDGRLAMSRPSTICSSAITAWDTGSAWSLRQAVQKYLLLVFLSSVTTSEMTGRSLGLCEIIFELSLKRNTRELFGSYHEPCLNRRIID